MVSGINKVNILSMSQTVFYLYTLSTFFKLVFELELCIVLCQVFYAIQGIYYQAEVLGQTVTWVLPHKVAYEVCTLISNQLYCCCCLSMTCSTDLKLEVFESERSYAFLNNSDNYKTFLKFVTHHVLNLCRVSVFH